LPDYLEHDLNSISPQPNSLTIEDLPDCSTVGESTASNFFLDTFVLSFDFSDNNDTLLNISPWDPTKAPGLTTTEDDICRFSHMFPADHQSAYCDAVIGSRLVPSTLTFHNSQALAPRTMTKSNSQTSTTLLRHMIGSFPEMMLRPDNLPPFIHPTHFSVENKHEINLEPLVACRSLAQMFSIRTKESSRFLWRMMKAESDRLLLEVRT
jgi:hypothetical protein